MAPKAKKAPAVKKTAAGKVEKKAAAKPAAKVSCLGARTRADRWSLLPAVGSALPLLAATQLAGCRAGGGRVSV